MATEEKTEQATPRRRQKAREEGQAAQSKDLTGAVALGAAVLVCKFAGEGLSSRVCQTATREFIQAGSFAFTTANLSHLLHKTLSVIGAVVLPIALVGMAFAIITTFAQTNFLLAPKRVSPEASKLNPIEGFKRLFSLNGLVEAIKGLLKVVIVGWIAYRVFRAHETEVLNFVQMSLPEALETISSVVFEFAAKYCLALLAIGGADYAYQRWQFEKQLRMSRHELKQERKETEGDPQVRSRRQQDRRALLEQGISAELPSADVVVTNPVHYAVALKYDEEQMDAPKVVAKGRATMAERIKKLARQHAIPVLADPPVARALYETTALGEQISPVLYQAVAEILAAVYRAAEERRQRRLERIHRRRAQPPEEAPPPAGSDRRNI
ncbi:MAG: flagellar biosynthesis protein FlhB [Armatimonadota bacterium]